MALSVTWKNNWLSDASIGNTIDDQVNDLSSAIDERMVVGGRYWPSSNVDECGVRYLGNNTYQVGGTSGAANQFAVFDHDGSNAPDTSDLLLELTGTNFNIGNSSTSIASKFWGDLELTGDLVGVAYDRTIVVEAPSTSENLGMGSFDKASTITKIDVVAVGTTPSCTFQLKHGSDRSAAGTAVIAATAITNTTTRTSITGASITSASITAGDFLWLTTSATSGTVTQIEVTVYYTVD